MASKDSVVTVVKKRRVISLKKKGEILKDIEAGMSKSIIMQKHDISKTTVHEIKVQKDKIEKLIREVGTGAGESMLTKRSRVSMNAKKSINDAVFQWYTQQLASNIPVRGIDVRTVARHFAAEFGDVDFKASSGWLQKFQSRHGLSNRKLMGEAASADMTGMESFLDGGAGTSSGGCAGLSGIEAVVAAAAAADDWGSPITCASAPAVSAFGNSSSFTAHNSGASTVGAAFYQQSAHNSGANTVGAEFQQLSAHNSGSSTMGTAFQQLSAHNSGSSTAGAAFQQQSAHTSDASTAGATFQQLSTHNSGSSTAGAAFQQQSTETGPSLPTSAANKPDNYQLRHKNHLSLVLSKLAEDEAFMDVTLTAEGRPVKAHKSVLSAVSPYFSSVLRANPCQHPIIILPRDISFSELSSIVMYIYRGEMTVSADDLASLLHTAELLEITGLSQGHIDNQPENKTTSNSSTTFREKSSSSINDADDSDDRFGDRPSATKQDLHHHSTGDTVAKVMSPPTEPMMLNPADFMDLEMTCVKEEVNTNDEGQVYTQASREVTTPPAIEDPLSSFGCSSDPLKYEDSPPQPTPSATTSRQDLSGQPPTLGQEVTNAELKLNYLKTLANVANLATPRSVSPSHCPSPNSRDAAEPVPNVCPYCCDYIVEDIRSHLSVKHCSKPSFVCPVCRRVYTRKNALEVHSKHCENRW